VKFQATPLEGAYVVEPEVMEDERGGFARTWCEREFAALGLEARVVQCNVSFNRRAGTLRGLHYQEAPHGEAKLVRCTRGAVHDVIVDLRPGSATRLVSYAIRLDADSRRMLFVPRGFAHGFQTLADDSEVFYQMSAFHEPSAARGLRWDDPALGIRWPLPDPILSPRDREHPLIGTATG
jgi:dTDP-4-dehydrorhamnose 3,5-epimerase